MKYKILLVPRISTGEGEEHVEGSIVVNLGKKLHPFLTEVPIKLRNETKRGVEEMKIFTWEFLTHYPKLRKNRVIGTPCYHSS